MGEEGSIQFFLKKRIILFLYIKSFLFSFFSFVYFFFFVHVLFVWINQILLHNTTILNTAQYQRLNWIQKTKLNIHILHHLIASLPTSCLNVQCNNNKHKKSMQSHPIGSWVHPGEYASSGRYQNSYFYGFMYITCKYLKHHIIHINFWLQDATQRNTTIWRTT